MMLISLSTIEFVIVKLPIFIILFDFVSFCWHSFWVCKLYLHSLFLKLEAWKLFCCRFCILFIKVLNYSFFLQLWFHLHWIYQFYPIRSDMFLPSHISSKDSSIISPYIELFLCHWVVQINDLQNCFGLMVVTVLTLSLLLDDMLYLMTSVVMRMLLKQNDAIPKLTFYVHDIFDHFYYTHDLSWSLNQVISF